jgi:hypothetical protein
MAITHSRRSAAKLSFTPRSRRAAAMPSAGSHETTSMSDMTSTPTLADQFVALATALLARLSAHDKALDAALAADAEANTKIADLTGQLSAANDQIATLQAKVAAELDPTPLTNVIAQMQAAVSAPDQTAPSEDSVSGSAPAAPAQPVVTEAPSGAVVTVDAGAGTTTHEDTSGTTTVVPHDGSAPTATDSAGSPVAPSSTAVDEATQAAASAGVTVGGGADSVSGALGNDMVHEAV